MTAVVPALVLPDGRRIELDDDVVIGRAPIAPAGWPSARSISLAVPTVSKTHVLVGHDTAGTWLIDLHSSNGSEVLDVTGMGQKAVPGERLAVPIGCHVRVGTDTIITVDPGATVPDDDLDRTVAVKSSPGSAPGRPHPPVIASPLPSWVQPSSQPPPPVQHPSQPPPPVQPSSQPPPPVQPLSQPPAPVYASQPPVASADSGAAGSGFPQYVGAPVPASNSARSSAHLIGGIVLVFWSAVAFLAQRGWFPDQFFTVIDGRVAGFFFVPDRDELEFMEYFSFIRLPDALGFLSWAADIGPVLAVIAAIVALVVGREWVRRTLAGLIAVPMILNVGLIVTLALDRFSFVTDNLDRFIPWFVLPVIGMALVLWPSRRSGSAPSQQAGVFYAPGQQPGPPFSGPGGPSYS